MKIDLTTNSQILLIIFLLFLIKDHNSSRTKLKVKNKSKAHLYPSTTENCGALCMECSLHDSQSCISCKPGIYEYENKCYVKCPDNTFADEEWQICQNCDPSCPVCWGPTSEMCGMKKGLKTTMVFLENEIKNYFIGIREDNKKRIIENNIIENNLDRNLFKELDNNKENNFKNKDSNIDNSKETIKILENQNKKKQIDINNWLNNINMILKKVNPTNLFPKDHKRRIDFTKDNDIESTISINDVYGSRQIFSELPIGSFSRKDGIFIPVPSYLDENMDIIDSHWIFVKGNWVGNKWVNQWVPKLPTFIKKYGKEDKMYYENGGYWIYDNRKGNNT